MPRRVFRVDPKLFDHEEFLRAVNSKDHLGILLRTHAYIEAFLLDLIDSQLPWPEQMEWSSRIGFEDKVNLAIALDLLDPSEKGPYLKLNTMRNKVAHHPQAVVTVDEIKELIDSLNAVQLWTFVAVLGREPLAGRDLQRVIAILFLHLTSKVPLAEAQRAKPTGRRERYEKMLQESQKKLRKFRQALRRTETGQARY